MVKGSNRNKASFQALSDLNLLSHQVNEALRFLDPHFHNLLCELRKETLKESFTRGYGAVDCSLQNGREILFNKESEEHVDQNDPQYGWAVLVALGSFTGGDFSARELGITTRFLPGDMVLVRGRVIKHAIGPFTGQRISVPYFTHSSVWEAFDMLPLVSI
jgi:hypothetical protein